MIDLRGYKVIYGEKVLNALCLANYFFEGEIDIIMKPTKITVWALDTDGILIQIEDESWRFQFIPNLTK